MNKMALSFRREPTTEAPEALVFADGFAEIEQLAEDLDLEFGPDHWLEVSNAEAEQALEGAARDHTLAIVTLGSDQPDEVEETTKVIRRARGAELLVLLVCGDISPRTMHQLIREGVTEFAPYPEPKGALAEGVNRLRLMRSSGGRALTTVGNTPKRKGKVITVYGVAGGVGASTYAVNLSWELANQVRRDGRRVVLMDFNFQYGSVATFLDVPRREAVYELVSEASSLDQTGLTQALSTYLDRLHVLTAPRDALPLDIVSPTDIGAIIKHAREMFDYVVIDMPQALMSWSEQVYTASDEFHAMMEIDMRSAQNMFRFIRTLKSEDMGLETLVFLLNRSPGMTDLSGKARVKRVAESLGIDFSFLLPDGGKQVINACDQGVPLAEAAKSNPLRREIVKVAQRILATEQAEAKTAQQS
ncbi:AAA family ATPase [Rhodobacteraceae bacterium NNCM2]|nr:AAA family ATPase [Coraliihabitans acroporae]